VEPVEAPNPNLFWVVPVLNPVLPNNPPDCVVLVPKAGLLLNNDVPDNKFPGVIMQEVHLVVNNN